MKKLCYLLLTCSEDQKDLIAKTLLEKRLIVCAKFIPVNSMYNWQGKIANEDEVAILMETAENLFATIEAEIAKIHSYDTFVLTQIPITNINSAARSWMEDELDH